MGDTFWGRQAADVKAINMAYKGIETPSDLYEALLKIWSADTCAPRMRASWTKENRTLGQCSITAFLAQDIFGGKVYGIARPGGSYHCYNVVGDCAFDLTSEQFGGEILCYENNPEQLRETHFGQKEEKRLRYEYLKLALKELCEREYLEELLSLKRVAERLRADDGCPWDKVQTHESLKPRVIEEAAEVISGVNIYQATGNSDNLKEELGDLMFQVYLQAQIAEEEGLFTLDDVRAGITEKMIRRHPHVFGAVETGEGSTAADSNPGTENGMETGTKTGTENGTETGTASGTAPAASSKGEAVDITLAPNIREWEAIKKKEKAGKEWMDAYLPQAFDEAEEMIDKARDRKGIPHKDGK